ncbi:Nop53 (60S ribosomal biogenesis) [Giardia muris]|uniref:Ribosome biogenesis protein NOP53 n=1 Tax=Giardia muris TaxID=5742 RepID=A0A4Z1SV90_GIAMU|nr:Nop53 (60S ribosomal biogenesis) [Giardia muris]|eukprot:TNJ29580.1 Nop53 (60S ribosomal biogenesis) [Giardia muris]
MSKKSKLRMVSLRHPKKVAVRRLSRRDVRRGMDDGWVDDIDLTPKEYLVSKLPEPKETETTRPQADRDAEDTQRLLKSVGGDLDALYQRTAQARIIKSRLAKKNHYLKTFDIWESPPENLSAQGACSPNDTIRQGGPLSEVSKIPTNNSHSIPLPETAISYNPTIQAQQRAIKTEAARILREDKTVAAAHAICGPSEGYKATLQDDREAQILDSLQDQASKEQEPLITTCQDVSRDVPLKPLRPGLENVLYGEALKINLTDETAQALLEGHLTQKRATLADRKAMRQTARDLAQELNTLENKIRFLTEAEKYVELRAQQNSQTPMASAKRKKQLEPRVQAEDIPVPLTEDCTGSLRLAKPIGSVAESLWLNAQRRNLIEVPNVRKHTPRKRCEYIIY